MGGLIRAFGTALGKNNGLRPRTVNVCWNIPYEKKVTSCDGPDEIRNTSFFCHVIQVISSMFNLMTSSDMEQMLRIQISLLHVLLIYIHSFTCDWLKPADLPASRSAELRLHTQHDSCFAAAQGARFLEVWEIRLQCKYL